MSERRAQRNLDRTDEQIRRHTADMDLLQRISHGDVVNTPELRWDLRRLARDDLITVGFGTGTKAMLLPRGERLLA